MPTCTKELVSASKDAAAGCSQELPSTEYLQQGKLGLPQPQEVSIHSSRSTSPRSISVKAAGRVSGGTRTLTGPKPENPESRRERGAQAPEGRQQPGVRTDASRAALHPRLL